MEKYSRAVGEMYSQFKQREAHPMEKYIGRHAIYWGQTREVVGYAACPDGAYSLIVDAPEDEGWQGLGDVDVIIKKCEGYLYAGIDDLID